MHLQVLFTSALESKILGALCIYKCSSFQDFRGSVHLKVLFKNETENKRKTCYETAWAHTHRGLPAVIAIFNSETKF